MKTQNQFCDFLRTARQRKVPKPYPLVLPLKKKEEKDNNAPAKLDCKD
jgi:hypothetical protein